MRRIEHGVRRPEAVTIEVDGETVAAYPGESLAAALLAAGRRAFRTTQTGAVRGPFCNMGVCFDCLVEADGTRVRACMTAVRPRMRIRTGAGPAG